MAQSISGGKGSARLTEGAKISRQAIRKHLRALEEAGLVSSERVGRKRIWKLQPTRLSEARQYLNRISAQWDAALNSLRLFVGEEKS